MAPDDFFNGLLAAKPDPVRLFDAVTGSAFASKGEAFLVFPTVSQIAAAILADGILFCGIACARTRWGARRRREPEAGGGRPPA